MEIYRRKCIKFIKMCILGCSISTSLKEDKLLKQNLKNYQVHEHEKNNG